MNPGTKLSGFSIDRVVLQVADLERSQHFYSSILGMRVLSHSEKTIELAAHSGDVVLVELRGGAVPNPAARRRLLGLYHFAILLPDRASLGRFARHAMEQGIHLGAADHLVSEALYLNDPDGLGIEVYADRPRESWKRAAGQIVMASDPLDWASLEKATNGEAWTGMPVGTRVGHVHLHVGDIARAAAFYHVALGLEKTLSSYPGALFLAADGYHHHLGLNTWAGPSAVSPATTDAQLLEWHARSAEAGVLSSAAQRLADAGFAAEMTENGFRVIDPWGTALHLSS